MLRSACRIGLAAALFGLLLAPGVSGGEKEKKDEKIRPVQDEAGFFGKDAIEQATRIIAKIKEKHRKDLWIETIDKGPARDEAAKWARDRFNNSGLDGIYIIISKNPKHFEVYFDKTKAKGYFTQDNAEELIKILKENLGENMNVALGKAVTYVEVTMDENHKVIVARPVQDDAGLFSKDALEQANKVITQIKEKSHKDLWIETMERGKDKAEAAAWAGERLKSSGLDGIYIMISKEPKHFEIVVGDKTKASFTQTNINEARKILASNLGKDRDVALSKVIAYVQETLAGNRKAKEPAPEASPKQVRLSSLRVGNCK